MVTFIPCLTAQLKRIRNVFPLIFCMTLLLTAGIVLLASAVSRSDALSERKAKINIGLIGDVDRTYLDVGFSAIQKLDPSRYAIHFFSMGEAEAREKLARGEIIAYIAIPDDFIHSLNRGEDISLTYVTGSNASNIGTILMSEIMDVASGMATDSQNAIYGTRQLIAERDMWDVFEEATDSLFLHLVGLILNRMDLFLTECTGASEGMPFLSYYFVSFFIVFLLFWGIASSSLFIKKGIALTCLLKVRGRGVASQLCAEYAAYFALMLINLFLMIVPLGAVFHSFDIRIAEWEAEPITELFFFLVRLIPVAAVIAALQFFLYELTPNMLSGIFLQFLTAISLSYLSGCLYPIAFFPESIQRVAPWLPSGAALRYAGKCLTSSPSWREALPLLAYFPLFLGVAAAIRTWRMRR